MRAGQRFKFYPDHDNIFVKMVHNDQEHILRPFIYRHGVPNDCAEYIIQTEEKDCDVYLPNMIEDWTI